MKTKRKSGSYSVDPIKINKDKDTDHDTISSKITFKVKRRWLEMTPKRAKKLSPEKLYKILSTVLPQIKRIDQLMSDLTHVVNLCKEHQIVPLTKKHGKVLQFREVFVAILSSPYTNIYQVLASLESKHPKLKKEIAKLKAKATKMVPRLVTTTSEELEAGNPSKFPISISPHVILNP